MRNFLLFLFLTPSVFALPCLSNSNGDWTAPAVWTNCNGGVPGNGDTAKIIHAVTISTTITVGTSSQDSLTVIPPLAAIEVNNTNGTTSNGSLTLGNGAVLSVRGSVLWVGNGVHAPVLTINQDALWVFDQSAASDPTTAYYRNYATAGDSFTMLRTVGATGHRVTIRGKPAACAACAPAIWSTELNFNSGTGHYSTFSHDYVRTDFYDFGSAADVYRSAYFACSESDHLSGQQMHMSEVIWNNSSGFDSSGSNGYPCSYTDFNVQYFQSFSSTTATAKGFWDFRPVASLPAVGKARSVSYVYLDRGINLGGGNVTFSGFQRVSYIVLDGQYGVFGPSVSWPGSAAPNVDHMLVRVAGNANAGAPRFYGSTSYMLTVHDGDTGGLQSVATTAFAGGYDWVLDHVIWQHGDAIGSGSSHAYEHITGVATSTATWNNMLILPNAAQPGYTSHIINAGSAGPSVFTRFNHLVMAFGNNYTGSASGSIGAIYYGDASPCGITGSVPYLKNSILWNPNPTPNHNPVFAVTSGACTTTTVANNEFTPAGITNNDVFNWGTVSRWVGGTACGSSCTSNGTPYDYPASGSVPGANDLHLAPQFVWQVQHLVGAGPREWANIVHGADITSGETSTEVHFATTFALFANATINDTTTVAGLKGLVDEMFTWIYGEWSSTQPSLRGAADDGSDIGASPVVSTCPTVYPGSIWPACNTIASARHFFKRD